MASIVIGGMALAAYFSVSRWSQTDACRPGFGSGDAWNNAYQSPSNWLEALYMFAEALRYSYKETFGKWRTGDLLLGLAYLARRDAGRQVESKVQGQLLDVNIMSDSEAKTRLEDLKDIRRAMQLAFVTRFRKVQNIKAALQALGLPEEAVLLQLGRSALLKPLFLVVKDEEAKRLYVLIRGTTSIRDLFTTLTVKCKPHHVVGPGGNLVLGWAHFGMLASARWIHSQAADTLNNFLADNPDWQLWVVGHSLGGGTAALLCTLLRAASNSPAACARAVAVACPSLATKELATACAPFVTSVVHGTDFVPTMNEHTLELLRQEVLASSWFDSWRRDMRASSMMYRVAEGGMRAVGQGTMWTFGAVAGVGRATSRAMTSCVAARPKSVPPSRAQSLGDRDGSLHLAGDHPPPQPPSLTFAVQRHGATARGSDGTNTGASAGQGAHSATSGANGATTGSNNISKSNTGLFSSTGLRVKTRTSKENAAVPLLDTRRGGRSDSGPDLAGVADMEAATHAAAHERHLHLVPESSEQEESPGPWRPWQAWGQRWWVRRDTPTDRSARSAPPGQPTHRAEIEGASTEEASHLLQETDLERFKLLEAMLDEEEEARYTAAAASTPTVAQASQLAQAVLGEPTVAGMHAAALDFSTALHPHPVDGSSAAASPLASTAAMHTAPWPGARNSHANVAPVSAHMHSPNDTHQDEESEEDEDVVIQEGGSLTLGEKRTSLGTLRGGVHSDVFERGLSEDIVAYRRACERAELERRGAQPPRKSTGAQGTNGASSEAGSSPPIGGAARSDDSGDEGVPDVGEVGTGRYTKLYPVGRVIHVIPVELLGPVARNSETDGGTRASEGEGNEAMLWWSSRGTGAKGGDGKGIATPLHTRSPTGTPMAGSPRTTAYSRRPSTDSVGARVGGDTDVDRKPLLPARVTTGAPSVRRLSESSRPTLPDAPNWDLQGPTHVLLDDIPVDAYDKINLCRTMLADHLLWRYLAAWDTVLVDWESKIQASADTAATGPQGAA